ncbi:MAG: helix-turn-helix domain-containing protein [Faecalimonas sp.]|nr:helix-turn-helix domain-containing protein [Faecalimonas sp.]
MQKKFLSINETAEYSGIGRTTFRPLVGWGFVPATKIESKLVIRAETLDNFIRANEGKNFKNKYDLIAV